MEFEVLERTVRLNATAFLLCILLMTTACGGGGGVVPTTGPLSGNWEITLNRHSNPVPLLYSGFLMQSGDSITGSVILGDGCSGVGPVTGTVNGQDLSLTIGEFGQDLSLTGKVPTGAAPGSALITGEFSTLGGGCTSFPSTGVWSAVQVALLAGSFHGSLASSATPSNGTLNVTGTISQSANVGASNASLSGGMTAAGSTRFCPYLTTATITGLISGTSVLLTLYGPDGSVAGQIPATVNTAGKLLNGTYSFPAISKSCGGDSGSVQLTFP
jgi:hypothetical protein